METALTGFGLDTQHGRDVVNLTIELHPDELQVNIVGWNRNQSAKFRGWLLSDAGEHTHKVFEHGPRDLQAKRRGNIARRGTGTRPWCRAHQTCSQRAPHPGRSRLGYEQAKALQGPELGEAGLPHSTSVARPTVIAAVRADRSRSRYRGSTILPLLREINYGVVRD